MGIVLTFASIHAALSAEKATAKRSRESGLQAPELVPLPPQVKSDCGFGLLFASAESLDDTFVSRFPESEIEFEAAYSVVEIDAESGKRKEKRYERID